MIRFQWVRTDEGTKTALCPRGEIRRIGRVRMLTEEMGVNLHGMEIILRL